MGSQSSFPPVPVTLPTTAQSAHQSLDEYLRALWPPLPGESELVLDERGVVGQFGEDSPRARHVSGVLAMARDVASQLGLDVAAVRTIELAALWHDIGYIAPLVRTGFHPLDGAAFLARRGVAGEVVRAVFYHTGAHDEARELETASSIYARYPRPSPPSLATDVVTFCDLRTGRDGSPTTIAERLAEIVVRHGPNHRISRSVERATEDFRRAAGRVRAGLATAAANCFPWLFLDVDGTLLEPGRRPSNALQVALRRYIDAGGRVTLATGKHPDAISGLCSHLQLPGPHVALNGTALVRAAKVELLATCGEDALAVAARLRSEGIPSVYYTPEGTHSEDRLSSDHLHALASLAEPMPAHAVPSRLNSIAKVLCFVDSGDVRAERSLRALGAAHALCVVRTSDRFLEFVPKGYDKGTAARRIMVDAGWPSFHSAAVGDSENDLPLLRIAGLAAAVANASPDVRWRADCVVPAAAHDGVVALIDRILQEC